MELAIYEKEPESVILTVEELEKNGFGDHPLWGAFVAEIHRDVDGEDEAKKAAKESSAVEVIGMALFYYRFSTWRGRMLYLEDFIVTEPCRGLGAGKLLFDRVVQHAKEDGCRGMIWQALDWNKPAIDFYEKNNAIIDGGWVNCMLKF